MPQGWLCLVAVAVAVVKAEQGTPHLGGTPGMILLEEFISKNTEADAKRTRCIWRGGPVWLLWGLCGFQDTEDGDAECSGSIDPAYGGGYSPPEAAPHPGVPPGVAQLRDPSNSVSSSWCDFGLECSKSRVCVPGRDTKTGCFYVRQQYYAALDSLSYVSYRDDYRWPPACTREGQYAAVQRKGPLGEDRYVCVDSAGNTIFGRIFPWQEELLTNMNCKCSRLVSERLQAGESSVTLHCMDNGNFEALQCEGGWCWCVRPESGEFYGTFIPENAMQLLPCYNATLLGEQYLRRCESTAEANGELMDHMLLKGVLGPAGEFKCDADGSFSGEQCILGQCRCYDKYKDVILKLASGGGCKCARDQWLYNSQENSFATLNCASPRNGADAGLYYTYQYYGDIGVYCVDQDGVRASPMVYIDSLKKLEKLKCTEADKCQNGDNEACEGVCPDCDPSSYVYYDENDKSNRV
ncbi:hypothetical protein GWK47_038827 [Chionoecetes opilio]|uniref:Thyroglobulin type-1 domain-containing protein n=1 Tax=Chionoecetes opilio TaxID=41210 RepID=A0A8J5CY23_CHIOP|nr:hypothetical protein GWK47_038827 [Chionoecetes opilio]